jgi:dCMP deaminase
MKTILILHIPVLHAGYLQLIEKLKTEVQTLYVLGSEILKEFGEEGKEIRAIEPALIIKAIRSLRVISEVKVLDHKAITSINKEATKLVLAREQIVEDLAFIYFIGYDHKIIFESTFLRWDKKSVYSQEHVACEMSDDPHDYKIMRKLAQKEAKRSSDWWRQVGAGVVVDNCLVISNHNQHLPHELTPYAMGDPRDFIAAGKDSHLCSAIHAEQAVIAKAARQGIKLAGGTMFVTTFPCPVCAKLIAYSGIKKLVFSSGHASLDGQTVLDEMGVQIVRAPI